MVDVSSPSILQAYQAVREQNGVNWALFGYKDGTNNILEAKGTGSGGWAELLSHFSDNTVYYAIAKLNTGDDMSHRVKFVFVCWVGTKVSILQRARVSIHKAQLRNQFDGISVEAYGTTLEELKYEEVLTRVISAGGAHYDSSSYSSQSSRSKPATTTAAPRTMAKPVASASEITVRKPEQKKTLPTKSVSEPVIGSFPKTGKVEFGLGSTQGKRPSMEDRHKAILRLPSHPHLSFFGVYDGHAGEEASDFVEQRLHGILDESLDTDDLHNSIIQTFLRLDDEFIEECVMNMWESGTTVCTALIDSKQQKIIVPNLGDSRCIVCEGGSAIPLSVDHKPHLEEEKERINKAGFKVDDDGRINGLHSFSRSIGDSEMKQNFTKEPVDQAIVAVPTFHEHVISTQTEFLVLGCDGLWDVMDNQSVADWVRDKLLKGQKDLDTLAKDLAEHAVAIGSTDNVSVCVVLLP